jgi:hypothetical protein
MLWFDSTMEQIGQMPAPSRADLEKAARQFFGQLVQELDRPREFPADDWDNQIAYQVELSRVGKGRDDTLAGFAICHQRTPRERGRHVVTIEGVEVIAQNLQPGTAWLTSARHLRRIGYSPVPGGRVSLGYQPEEGSETTIGSLVVGFRQVLEWGDGRVLEIKLGPIAREDETAAPDEA